MRLPWRKTNSTAACWGRRVRPPCGLRVGVASDSEGSGTVRRTAWRDIFMMGDVVSDGVRGVPIATEKKQRSSREPMFRWLAEQPQAGAATWTTSSWARVWHARPGLLPHSGPICGLCGRGSERCDRAPSLAGDRMVMSSGVSYQDFGAPKSPRSSRAGSRRPCLSSRPCFSCSSGSVSRLIVSLLAWCAPAAGGAVLRNAPTHRPRKWSGSSWSRARAGSCRTIRTSSFSLEFTRSFHGAIDEQARLGYDPAHEVAVEAMVRQYSTDQLWHRCQVRCSA